MENKLDYKELLREYKKKAIAERYPYKNSSKSSSKIEDKKNKEDNSKQEFWEYLVNIPINE